MVQCGRTDDGGAGGVGVPAQGQEAGWLQEWLMGFGCCTELPPSPEMERETGWGGTAQQVPSFRGEEWREVGQVLLGLPEPEALRGGVARTADALPQV